MKKLTAKQIQPVRDKYVQEVAKDLKEGHVSIDGWSVTLAALVFLAEEGIKEFDKTPELKWIYALMAQHLRKAKEAADELTKYK